MSALVLGSLALGGTSNAGAPAAPGVKTYAQFLVEREMAKHPEIAVLAFHVTPPKAPHNIIIAANVPKMIGKEADADDMKVVTTGQPLLAVNKTGDRYEVQLPLLDANRRSIGSVGIVFPYHEGDDKAVLEKQGTAIRDELARRISHTANLLEPAVMGPNFKTDSYAQTLVDGLLDKYPQVVILALHASNKDHPGYPIVGSNIGRIGKVADEDDMHVITSGETKLELNETGDRFEVEQTLIDHAGKTIGAVGVVFPYRDGIDKKPLQTIAENIRSQLAEEITSVDQLFDAP